MQPLTFSIQEDFPIQYLHLYLYIYFENQFQKMIIPNSLENLHILISIKIKWFSILLFWQIDVSTAAIELEKLFKIPRDVPMEATVNNSV